MKALFTGTLVMIVVISLAGIVKAFNLGTDEQRDAPYPSITCESMADEAVCYREDGTEIGTYSSVLQSLNGMEHLIEIEE